MRPATFFFFFFEQAQLPFAVIGSREEVEVGGKKVRARKYPWGTVEGTAVHTHTHVYIRTCFDLVSLSLSLSLFPPSLSLFAVENEAHCDFTKLREMLLR